MQNTASLCKRESDERKDIGGKGKGNKTQKKKNIFVEKYRVHFWLYYCKIQITTFRVL